MNSGQSILLIAVVVIALIALAMFMTSQLSTGSGQ